MLISYHNHTKWSDGAPTLEEQLAQAHRLGLDEFGLSDHYTMYPGGEPVTWSMPLDFLDDYVEQLQQTRDRKKGMIVRVGIEADFFPETVDILRDTLAQHPFDYIIGSVHFLNSFPVDEDRRLWRELTDEEVNDRWIRYWQRITEMAESGVFDFAAHLDLPKKFGFRPTADLTDLSNTALDAIKASDMAIEINTSGWSQSAEESYPSLTLLKAAQAREIPLLINSDAHSPAHIIRNYDRARELADEAGYKQLVGYNKRERFTFPLSEK